MLVVGLMSGTSADGTDAVLMRLLGTPPTLDWKILAHIHRPHPPELRRQIFAAFRPETAPVDFLCSLNFNLGRAFAQAALEVIASAGLTPNQVDLIGSHGQTLWHIPAGQPDASTLQMGEPAVIAELTGIPVVSNFRTRDMAAGGQGAPLVAYVDTLLLSHPRLVRAAQNIGGIANVTYLPSHIDGVGQAFAFDTGPGNMLIDDAAFRATGGQLTCDMDGRLAARGRVSGELLAELLRQSYLQQAPPKTTGRELFGAQFGAQTWERAAHLGLTPEDTVATLTAYTAESIAAAYRDFLPAWPDEVIVSGGGALNPVLMEMLRQRVAPARVLTTADFGLGVEQKEAAAFAILAYETWYNRPGNLPGATGASHPVILGNITPSPIIPAGDNPEDNTTEHSNPRTANLDALETLEMVEVMSREDARVHLTVAQAGPAVASAIDSISSRMATGGRLIYLGAGTSGRLGVLDASECPPTFNAGPGQVIGIIAGGDRALRSSVEEVEDKAGQGRADLETLRIHSNDSVVGITASGNTPYVLGGLQYAREIGALTVGIACNSPAEISEWVDIAILLPVGPEVINGSTRLKAGTAQKMVLNQLSTGVMVRLGKTYGNMMVDVRASNAKLRRRAVRMVQQICGLDEKAARVVLESCHWEVKTAVVCQELQLSPPQARATLEAYQGKLRPVLENR